uniref:Secreted protein n=1 Tax=Loa loa TaxID=7209 RepID=A0A1I7VM86_LOALO
MVVVVVVAVTVYPIPPQAPHHQHHHHHHNNPFSSLTSTQHFTTLPQLVVHMMRKDELDSDLNRSIKQRKRGNEGRGKNGPSLSMCSSTGPHCCHRQPLNPSITVRTIFCSSVCLRSAYGYSSSIGY